MASSWLSTVPALNQLGATMGVNASGYPSADSIAQILQQLAQPVIQSQLDEAQKRADQQYHLQRDQLNQQWKIAQVNAKSASERNAIDKWYNEQQVELAKQRLAEDSRQFNVKTGYDVLNMGAQLQGPRNWAQYQRLAAGTAANPNTATLFNNLGQAVTSGGYKGFGPGALDPQTLASMVSDMSGGQSNAFAGVGAIGGGGANGTPQGGAMSDFQREQQAALPYIMNPNKIGSGVIESWNPDKQDMFASLIGASGASVPTWLDTLKRSRLGNTYSGNAA